MSAPPSARFEVRDASGVGAARRGAADLAARLGYDDARSSDVAIVATELASNLVKHAGGGELLLSAPGPGQLELLSLDRGPGLGRPREVLRDGYSTSATPGTGLGAVRRLASRFDLYAAPGEGSVIWATLTAGRASESPPAPFEWGAVHVPYPGELVNGDGFVVSPGVVRLRALLVDGLGHGPLARQAARTAEDVFRAAPHLAPRGALERIHAALRGARGAVGAALELDSVERRLSFSGVGNVTAALVTPDGGRRGLLSHNGTLGQEARTFSEEQLPWPPDGALILHSDGLSGRWNLEAAPGLLARAPAVIAGVLYRDFARGRDDATVLVIKAPA